MKKFYYLCAALLVTTWGAANAQSMAGYSLDATIGTYEEITDGTVIPFELDSASMASMEEGTLWPELDDYVFIGDGVAYEDDFVAQGMPIGFDFEFNDEVMNQFVLAPNGHLILGKDSVDLSYAVGRGYNAFTSSYDCKNMVGMAQYSGHLATTDTEFSYKVEGEAPNRELVVQYKNLVICYAFNWDDVPTNSQIVQYQIRLVEGTNEVKLVFNDWDRSESSYTYSNSTRIGVKGDASNLATITSESGSWEEGISLTDAGNYISYSSSYYPSNGLTYTMTPGGACAAPATQATELELTSTSVIAGGSYIATEDADHYLVVMTIGEPTEIPTDGITYSAGDSIGNSYVVTWTTDTTFATSSAYADALTGSTAYTFTVYAANSFCSGGVTYNSVEPLTATITTLPAAPTSLTVGDVDKTSIEVIAEANATGDQVIIAYTTEVYTNTSNQDLEYGAFGTPTAALAVGDSIDGGGYIMYIGEAGTAKIEGLLEDETYHFWAWSYDPEIGISSAGVYANDHTAGSIPFVADFTEPYVAMPFGWSYECLTTVGSATAGRVSTYDAAYITISAADAANGSVFTLTSPWVYMTDNSIGHRVLFNYNMQLFASYSWSSYNTWGDQDSLAIQVSNDGIEWQTISSIDSSCNPQQSASTSFVATSGDFEGYEEEKVKFRIYWRSATAARMYVSDFAVEEIGACDYPTNVSVNSTGSSATVAWDSEADLWEIQYKASSSDEWSTTIETSENPYTITDLPGVTAMDIRVRTKCSFKEFSTWSETISFSTGYIAPFTFSFTTGSSTLASGWSIGEGALTEETTVDLSTTSLTYGYNRSISGYYGLYMNTSTAVNSWILSPVVDLGDGSTAYNYEVSMMPATVASTGDEVYKVVVSTDGGATFKEEDVILTLTADDFALYSQDTHTASLNGYTGEVCVGLYIETENAPSYMIFYSIGITASCPSDIVTEVEEVTTESAKVSWTSDAEEFYVFSRLAGETTKAYSTTTDMFIELENLESRTAYEVGITKACEEGDTAAVTIVTFTTAPSTDCDGLTSTPTAVVTPYTATLSWDGDALKYNIRIQEIGDTAWTIVSTTETSYTFTGLTPEASYEYGVQSVCSDYEGDYSDWTETAEFTTLAVTCFAPEDLVITTTHKDATLTWSGDAESYEINYRLSSSGSWTDAVIVTESELVIENLTPETSYKMRIKTTCSESEESAWSSIITFTTAAIPECVVPSNLTASNIDVNSVTLSWDADESNLTWDLRYRASVSTTYSYAYELAATSYDAIELEEETAYIWSVMATCDEARTSAWATQGSWSTISGINSTAVSEIGVFVSKGVLNVINSESLWIKQMDIYSISGKLLNSQVIEAGENILMPLNSDNAQLIVRLTGNGWSESYTIIVK